MKHPSQIIRRGSLLLEVVVSSAMLAAVLILIARMSVAMNQQASRVDVSAAASAELQNQMERFAVMAPAERLGKNAAILPIDDSSVAALRDVELQCSVEDGDQFAGLQRVRLLLRYAPAERVEPTRLSLVAFFPGEGGSE